MAENRSDLAETGPELMKTARGVRIRGRIGPIPAKKGPNGALWGPWGALGDLGTSGIPVPRHSAECSPRSVGCSPPPLWQRWPGRRSGTAAPRLGLLSGGAYPGAPSTHNYGVYKNGPKMRLSGNPNSVIFGLFGPPTGPGTPKIGSAMSCSTI